MERRTKYYGYQLGVWGLGFGGFGVWGLGFGVWGLEGLGFEGIKIV